MYTIAGDAMGDAFYGGVGALQRIGHQAVGRRLIVRLDGYAAAQRGDGTKPSEGALKPLSNSSRATSGISSWPVLELE